MKKIYIPIVFMLLAIFVINISSAKKGEIDAEITSETENVSAQCFINNLDRNIDKKRKRIGIGETVTLKLEGKDVGDGIIVNKWTITEGEAFVEKISKDTDQEFKFTAKCITEQAQLTIEADIQSIIADKKLQITFTIIPPTGIKSIRSKQANPSVTFDTTLAVGVENNLELTLLPLDVCFKALFLTEFAEDKEGAVPAWLGAHTPSNKAMPITDGNKMIGSDWLCFYEPHLSTYDFPSKIANKVEGKWNCVYYVCDKKNKDNNEYQAVEVGAFYQTFIMEKLETTVTFKGDPDSKPPKPSVTKNHLRVTIKKFDSSAVRDTQNKKTVYSDKK